MEEFYEKTTLKTTAFILVACLILPCLLLLSGCGNTHKHTDAFVIYYIENNKAYKSSTCECETVTTTELTDAIIVNPSNIQQHLDNATDNTTLVLAPGTYDRLYIRKTSESTQVDSTWEGGNHTFESMKLHCIFFNGSSSTLNKYSKIEILGNTIKGSIGERFARISGVNGNAEITFSHNTVIDGTILCNDPDIVKISEIDPNATVVIDETNTWNGKTTTISRLS